MLRRISALALAIVAGALLLPGRASAYTPHVFVYSDNLEVATLNPFLGTSGNIANISELTMAEFTRFDDRANPIPDLVTVVPTVANHGVSADGKTITWHLRHGVKWSDGQPFDGDDVVYTVSVAKDKDNNLAVHDPWDRLESVSEPDKFTIVFHLKEAYSGFLGDYFAANASQSCILPKHILGPGTKINDAPYNALPVGIGPFRYTAFKRGDDVEMEANPYYWRGKPKLTRIVYKILPDQNTTMTQLQTGEIDMWDTINGTYATRAKGLAGKANFTRLSTFMGGLYFNTSHPQLSDVRVRLALRLATDRNKMFEKVFLRNGKLTESVVPRVSRDWADLPFSAYNPAQAQKMLDAAGWKRGAGGIRAKNGVQLVLDVAIPSGYQPSATLAALLHDDWGAIGVGVTIHTYATSQFFTTYSEGGIIQNSKFDVASFSQSANLYANVNGLYDCAGIPPHGQNSTKYCNKSVDAAINDYLHTLDPALMKKYAKEFQTQIDRDAPAIILYERGFLAVFDNHLTGYHPGGFTTFGDPMMLDM